MDVDNNPRVTPPCKNGGTSTHGEFQAHLAPSLLAALEKCQDVSVDQFLTGLLGFVREKGAAPERSLPDLISEVGVEVANLFCQVAGNTPSTAAASQNPSSTGNGYGYGLLQELAKNETKRYPIFCKIVNSILARTKTKNLKGFLESNDLDILLQNTSLFEVKIYHQGQESTRKPDCTFLPSAIAKRYVLEGHVTQGNGTVDLEDKQQLWNAIVDKVAGTSLNTRIMYMEWDMHHGVVEKKTGRSIKNYQVPTSYQGNQRANHQKHSDIVDTMQVKLDPSTSMHPSRTPQSLEKTSVGSGSKRLLEDLEKQEQEQDKDESENDEQPETIPEVQFAGYNAEMLCALNVIRQHTIGMLNEDEYVHLWWFDHQGPVRSSPLNFIDDLPRFVVFLWILQRLTPEGWGYVPIMYTAPSGEAEAEKRLIASKEGAEVEQDAEVEKKAKAKSPPPAPIEINCKGEIYSTDDPYSRIHHIWGLNGRRTCVREMRGRSNPTVTVAVKVAWQEESKTSEKEIFDHIDRGAKDDPMIKGHIPELFQEETFAEYGTGTFRLQAEISSATRCAGYRVLRITVYSMLAGCITDLGEDDFWSVLLQCFDCHYKLWLSGVHHRDVSAFNLMYKRSPDGKIIGVLIDFDLAIISESRTENTKRTGTMPFMALDVLEGITTSGPHQHLYRHDAESFLWVAIWVCCTFERGKERENPPFKDWTRGDAKHCLAFKQRFLNTIDEPWPVDHEATDEILQEIRHHLRKDQYERVTKAIKARKIRKAGGKVESEVPESPEAIYEEIGMNLLGVLRKEPGEPGMNVD